MEPAEPPCDLSEPEAALWRVLHESVGRVVTRTELMRRAGLRHVSARRIDVLLVAVRRAVGAQSLVNVRGRGWMLLVTPPSEVPAGGPDRDRAAEASV